MPIKIPSGLPAADVLTGENIFLMDENRAVSQDIRPLKIAILNLMPTKITTETQLARLLSNTPLQVELTLLHTTTHESKHTAKAHMDSFYRSFDEVKEEKFDGLIITGAPVENLPFEEVDYWPELCRIFDWSKEMVYSTFHICWAAQAGLYYHFGIQKHSLPEKRFGVYSHRVVTPTHPLVRGFDEQFLAPHSRHTEVSREAIAACPELEILAESQEAGVYIAAEKTARMFFVTGHPEYDADTLAREYFRDKDKGLPIAVPKNYFPGDDDTKVPVNGWRSHAHLLYSNWLNYFVYQMTPYDIRTISKTKND